MKNFDAEAHDSVAVGAAIVSLYVDACVAANQAMLQYARLLTTLAWQPYPLPVVAARTVAAAAFPEAAAASAERRVAAALPQRDAGAEISREAGAPDARKRRKSSRSGAVAVAAPRKISHKKSPASAVKHRTGVAKRRVRAAR